MIRAWGLILVGLGISCATSGDGYEATPPETTTIPPAPTDFGDGGTEAANPSCSESALAAARSAAGCRFVATEISWSGDKLPNWEPEGCHVLVVTNASTTKPARLRLRFNDREEDAAPYAAVAQGAGLTTSYAPLTNGILQPNQTAILSMMSADKLPGDTSPPTSACPTTAFVNSRDPSARHEAFTPSIELLSDTPILAVRVHGFKPSIDLSASPYFPTMVYPIFPTHLFSQQVIETGIFKPGLPSKLSIPSPDSDPLSYSLAPVRRAILSASDETQVTLSTPEGGSRTITLHRGEVWADDPNDAFVGKVVSATRPVGVMSFAPNALTPWDFPDHPAVDDYRNCSMSLPEALWGSEYVAVRHRDRWKGQTELAPWRLIGGADSTVLAYEPARPEGAPETLQRGQLAVFFADAPFVVRSQDEQHAFYVGAHMTGAEYAKQRSGTTNGEYRGAPQALHTIATARWVNSYSFLGLSSFPNLNLVVVRKSHGADVRLDCAGVLGDWQSIGASYEYARVELTGPRFEAVRGCTNGSYRIESSEPFSVTVWSWGEFDQADPSSPPSGAYSFPVFGADVSHIGSTQ